MEFIVTSKNLAEGKDKHHFAVARKREGDSWALWEGRGKWRVSWKKIAEGDIPKVAQSYRERSGEPLETDALKEIIATRRRSG